jgi:hypothetical protein
MMLTSNILSTEGLKLKDNIIRVFTYILHTLFIQEYHNGRISKLDVLVATIPLLPECQYFL